MGRKANDSGTESGNKRQKKILNHAYKLKHIKPITDNQEKAFHAYFQEQNLLLHGVAGTGKTYISLFLALNDLLTGRYKRVIVVRSMVPSRDMGFLPGTYEEKMKIYEMPYKDMVNDLLQRGDAYDNFKKKGWIEFMSTSYIRGLTLDDSLILLDEAQNLTDHETNSILTRLGENSRILICGDFRQNDLLMNSKKNGETGVLSLIKVAEHMPSMDVIEFGISDIVRSGFVREYIIARLNLDM